MSETYLGKPSYGIEENIKNQYCDIFTLKDGSKVRPKYEPTKTSIDINYPKTELSIDLSSIDNFSFGKSYTKISDLYYYETEYGIDLSRTQITYINQLKLNSQLLTSVSLPNSLSNIKYLDIQANFLSSVFLPQSLKILDTIDLMNNKLTSFTIPNSLSGFNQLYLTNNNLSTFSIPDQIVTFYILWAEGNKLTSFTIPNSVSSFGSLWLNSNELSTFSMPNSIVKFEELKLYDNRISTLKLPEYLKEFARLTIDNSCSIDMTHITDASKIPTILNYGGIYDASSMTYQGTIKIKSGLLSAFQEKWGSQYNYQEV